MEFNKTDEELKQMTDDELFEYLDAKAAYLKSQSVPLDQYHTKKFASASLGSIKQRIVAYRALTLANRPQRK